MEEMDVERIRKTISWIYCVGKERCEAVSWNGGVRQL